MRFLLPWSQSTAADRAALGALGLGVALTIGCNSLIGIQKAREEGSGSGGRGGDDACDLELDEDFVRGCVLRMGCDPGVFAFNLSGCLTFKLQGALPGERATLNAEDCAVVEEKIGRRYEPPSVCAGRTGWSCDGAVALYCGDDAKPFSRDCSVVGAECTVPASAPANAQPCGIRDLTNCGSDETRATVCEGNFQLGCTDGAPVGYDCGVLQTSCVQDDESAVCMPSGASCDPSRLYTCSGDDIRYCASVGIASLFECHKGSKCEGDSDDTVGCFVPGCTPEKACEEGCVDDKTIRFCVADVAFERDCTDYGFERCNEATLSSGTPLAFCAMNGDAPPPGTTADWSGEPAPSSGGSSNGTGGRAGGGDGPSNGGSPDPVGTGGDGPGPDGAGGAPVNPGGDDYCLALPDPGLCSSVDYCVGDACYYLVDGTDVINSDCNDQNVGYDELAARCDDAPAPAPNGG